MLEEIRYSPPVQGHQYTHMYVHRNWGMRPSDANLAVNPGEALRQNYSVPTAQPSCQTMEEGNNTPYRCIIYNLMNKIIKVSVILLGPRLLYFVIHAELSGLFTERILIKYVMYRIFNIEQYILHVLPVFSLTINVISLSC